MNNACSVPFKVEGHGSATVGDVAFVNGRIIGDLAVDAGPAIVENDGKYSCTWQETLPGFPIGVYPCGGILGLTKWCVLRTPEIPFFLRLDVFHVHATGKIHELTLKLDGSDRGITVCRGTLHEFKVEPVVAGITPLPPVGGFIGEALATVGGIVNSATEGLIVTGIGHSASLVNHLGIGTHVLLLGQCP